VPARGDGAASVSRDSRSIEAGNLARLRVSEAAFADLSAARALPRTRTKLGCQNLTRDAGALMMEASVVKL
jgi:hypothetical protein